MIFILICIGIIVMIIIKKKFSLSKGLSSILMWSGVNKNPD